MQVNIRYMDGMGHGKVSFPSSQTTWNAFLPFFHQRCWARSRVKSSSRLSCLKIGCFHPGKSGDSRMYPSGKSLYEPYIVCMKMGYNPQESLENTTNTMSTLSGVHPSVPWVKLIAWYIFLFAIIGNMVLDTCLNWFCGGKYHRYPSIYRLVPIYVDFLNWS